jgi:hypothetical protein
MKLLCEILTSIMTSCEDISKFLQYIFIQTHTPGRIFGALAHYEKLAGVNVVIDGHDTIVVLIFDPRP